MPVQLAVARDEFTQAKALKIERLPTAQQEEIAVKIARGQDVNKCVKQYLHNGSKAPQSQGSDDEDSVEDQYERLLVLLAEYLEDFQADAGALARMTCTGVCVPELLADASQFFQTMSEQAQAVADDREGRFENMLEGIRDIELHAREA